MKQLMADVALENAIATYSTKKIKMALASHTKSQMDSEFLARRLAPLPFATPSSTKQSHTHNQTL
jgi:hypothetical protein